GDGAVPPDRRVVASARVARLAAREWCGRCVAVVGVEHGSTGPGATIARQRTVVRRVDQRGVAAEASGPCGARRNVAVWGWVGVVHPVGRPRTRWGRAACLGRPTVGCGTRGDSGGVY